MIGFLIMCVGMGVIFYLSRRAFYRDKAGIKAVEPSSYGQAVMQRVVAMATFLFVGGCIIIGAFMMAFGV